MTTPTNKQGFVDGLREMADFVEGSDLDISTICNSTFFLFCQSKEDFARQSRALGTFKKESCGGYVNATKHFGRLRLQVTAGHSLVCEKVKTGERVIPAKPEITTPAEPERVEETFEWKCPESFLALQTKEIEDGLAESSDGR